MEGNLLQSIKIRATRALARRLPACRQIVPLLSQAQDRKLSWRERLTTKLHLLTCTFCTRYVRQLEFLRTAVHTQTQSENTETAPPAGAPRLSPEARARLAEALRQKQEVESPKSKVER